jgi:hypothetical protein
VVVMMLLSSTAFECACGLDSNGSEPVQQCKPATHSPIESHGRYFLSQIRDRFRHERLAKLRAA